MRLYLVRHGQTDMNKNQMFYGWTDVDINAEGVRQAKRLREYFRGYEYLMEKGSCLMFAVRQEIGFLDAGGKQEKMEHYSEINAGTDEKRI